MGGGVRISRPNARFQQWEALLRNRSKRQHAHEFLVHGVRPITLALDHGWPIHAVIYPAGRDLSTWASDVMRRVSGDRVEMDPELLRQLSERDDDTTELVAVGALPPDDLARIAVGPQSLGMAFDRPSMPGNIGTIVRSLDAFEGSGLIVTGHAADPYDPRAVRASTGSVFSVPVVRLPSRSDVIHWVQGQRGAGVP